MSDKDGQNNGTPHQEKTPLISIHDLAEKITLPENTLRKYLAYFNLPVEKRGRKNYLKENTEHYLSEIIQLKNNGWSLKQIKAFREEQVQNKQNLEQSSKTESPEPVELVADAEHVIEPIVAEVNKPEEIAPVENVVEIIIEPHSEENVVSQPETISEVSPINNEVENINLQAPRQIEHKHEIEIPARRHIEEHSESDFEEQPSEDPFQQIQKPPLTKDFVNKEIATQAKRASRLYRFLSSRNSAKDSAELKADLDRRVEFLNGLRYLRDNWLDRSRGREEERERDLATVSSN